MAENVQLLGEREWNDYSIHEFRTDNGTRFVCGDYRTEHSDRWKAWEAMCSQLHEDMGAKSKPKKKSKKGKK